MHRGNRKWLYIGAVLAALLQTGILFGAVEKRATILRGGKEVVLQTEPVDPRDLMRGDYVSLRYQISSIKRDAVQGAPSAGERTLYVTVKPDGDGLAQFSRASFAPFTDLSDGEVQLRGTAVNTILNAPGAIISVLYGIERYYLPEGEGRRVEDAQHAKRITAVVVVDRNGQAVLKSLRDNGRQLYSEPLY